MRQITRLIETETGHRLTNYSGKCAHIHGHRMHWEVTVTSVSGELDASGFILDFGDLKLILNKVINQIDHAMLLSEHDPLVETLTPEELQLFFRSSSGDKGRLFVLPFNPTVENVSHWIGEQLTVALAPDFKLCKLKVYETSNSFCEIIYE